MKKTSVVLIFNIVISTQLCSMSNPQIEERAINDLMVSDEMRQKLRDNYAAEWKAKLAAQQQSPAAENSSVVKAAPEEKQASCLDTLLIFLRQFSG